MRGPRLKLAQRPLPMADAEPAAPPNAARPTPQRSTCRRQPQQPARPLAAAPALLSTAVLAALVAAPPGASAGTLTLRMSFGPPTDTPEAGYEAATKTMPPSTFTQWSQLYFGGSCFGAYWGGDYADLAYAGSSTTALGTFTTFPLGTYLCVLGVPVGSYLMTVSAGSVDSPTSGCFALLSGAVIYDNSTDPGQFASASALVFKQTADECLRLGACQDGSDISVWQVEQLLCDATCGFCTGTDPGQCAQNCKNGRLLTQRDGGTYCDPRPPYAPAAPTTRSVTNRSLTLSWSAPVTGGMPITSYRVLVAVRGGAFGVLLADTPPRLRTAQRICQARRVIAAWLVSPQGTGGAYAISEHCSM